MNTAISSRSQTLGYDNLNRVASASASGSYGSQSYTYDGVGNRLTRVLGGTTETYAYSSTANQVATITSGGNTRSFSYQASGQVSQDVRDASHTYNFAANDNGRNASAALNGTNAGAYLYNAFEERVQKTVGSAVTQFVFDRFGHLLAEANGSGAAQKEYLWLDDVPVAVVDASGASPVLYFIHSDQLGTPQKITNAAAVIVWDGVFDPFGNAQFVAGAGVWDSSNWDNFTWGADLSLSNLRFPGQYADAETALNQNWFRDYDPTIGRYIQSDPIGLFGGSNTYSYVANSPTIGLDPIGLQTIPTTLPGVPPLPPKFFPNTPANTALANKTVSFLRNLFRRGDDDCTCAVPRSAAMEAAYAYAGIPLSGEGANPIPWNQLNFPRRQSQAWASFQQTYSSGNMGYWMSANQKVTEHPYGHLDLLPGPSHHKCPHFHATNAAGQEAEPFEYQPGSQ